MQPCWSAVLLSPAVTNLSTVEQTKWSGLSKYLDEPWPQGLVYDNVISIQLKAVPVIDHHILAGLHKRQVISS